MLNTLWKLFSGGLTVFLVVLLCFHVAIQQVSGENTMDWVTIVLTISVLVSVFSHVFVEAD